MPAASGWRARWWRCSAGGSSSWCTTTTTSPGRKSTAASVSTWCSKAPRPATAHRGHGGGGGVRSLQGLTLHLVPQLVQLVERRAPPGDPAPFGEPLDRLEAAREFAVRLLERGARIDLELARQVHHCEQEIANLIFNRVPFPFSRFPVQFSQFLFYL